MTHRTALGGGVAPGWVRSAADVTVGRRGYSSDVVDTLVGRARAALDPADPAQRRAARGEPAAGADR
ncbi:hypothetical protein [Micromonospora sp. HUAS LYJ1]|uniref:hypothetical protein n=1 Tax=Micromonospora sp. HUAS LYJ1 TaxID=3061626 RepID=UPI0026712706|nr:hypothetical protein [Micromonospora sp. HUAS LYJ1]WKU07805.1 hypothetical protein Q2K16_12555 [Micromonospora sp. HUAS LYJ1]